MRLHVSGGHTRASGSSGWFARSGHYVSAIRVSWPHVSKKCVSLSRFVWELFAECLGLQKFAHLFRVVLSCMPVVIMEGVSKDAKKQGYGNSGHVRLLARLALMRMQVEA